MDLQVTTEQPDPSTIVLNIEVDEQKVARAFDSVYREFSRFVNVPGFRPGKAPRAILERYVNKDKVRERTLEKLIRESYPKALEEQGITPYSHPDIEPTDLEDKKPYTYKAIVPLEPQVILGEYTGLTVEKPIFPISDALIERRLTQMREERSRLERVADRGVQAGDVLIAENQVLLEGQEEAPAPRRQLVQVGNNIPGFDDAIYGMMPEEERTFELTYPDDYDEEDKRGKKATFTVKVNSISAKKLPELDDEFAKQFGAETIEDLRAKMREGLQAESTRLSEQMVEQRLIQEIHDRASISYPRALVREEMQDELKRLGEELRRKNLSYEQYLEQTNQTTEQLQVHYAQQAEARVRTILLLSKIAQEEGLQAKEEDIDAEFVRLTAGGIITEEQAEDYREMRHRRVMVANALVQQRLHDFLFAHNTVNEVEQAEPADPEALAEAEAEAEAASDVLSEE